MPSIRSRKRFGHTTASRPPFRKAASSPGRRASLSTTSYTSRRWARSFRSSSLSGEDQNRCSGSSTTPYEKALAGLGQLAGSTVLGRSSSDAEPDSVWQFAQELWVGFEAKSECKPAGKVPADTPREAGGHLNYTAASTGAVAPPGSFTVIISPQQDVHPAARAVVGDRVYLVPPEVISDIASRLTGAWDSIRIQTRTLSSAEAEPVITQILHARRALPSQWLPSLTARRVADG